MSEKLKELEELNEKFYKLFGRLHENKSLFNNAKAVEYFGDKIFEQYKIEYENLRIRFEEIEKPELYREQVKRGLLVPRNRFLLFRNRAKKLIDGEAAAELSKYFDDREKALKRQLEALEKLAKALENADSADRPTVFGESPDEEQKTIAPDLNTSELNASANSNAEIRSDESAEQVKEEKPKRKRKKSATVEQLEGQIGIEGLDKSAESAEK